MKKSLLAALLVVVFLGSAAYHFFHYSPKEVDSAPATAVVSAPTSAPRLTEARRVHILYGDENGGGHHHSADRPCKSEFPETWNEEKIIQTVQRLAANDNVPWRLESNGYFVAEQNYEELEIRIVLDEEADDIVTAYPVNVERNLCPANDNSTAE